MKNKLFLLLFVLCSCNLFSYKKEIDEGNEDLKKIKYLRSKLENDEKNLVKLQSSIETLKKQIYYLEIGHITKRLDTLEKQFTTPKQNSPSIEGNISALFIHERKILTEMIEMNSQDKQAQELLDRILRLITYLKRYNETAVGIDPLGS